jgi:DNA polymerase V
MIINSFRNIDIMQPVFGSFLSLPLVQSRVSAGFPSPADDYLEIKLDLNKYLIQHPTATFYVRVKGDSMENAGIFDDDLLIVDRAKDSKDLDIIVGVLDGEFTVKRLVKKAGRVFLHPENDNYKPIRIEEENDFRVWGVVTYVIHKP